MSPLIHSLLLMLFATVRQYFLKKLENYGTLSDLHALVTDTR